jgi:hypothetical protein
MPDDIIERLQTRLFWSDADDAIKEITALRNAAHNWEQTAKMLAIDLGNVEIAYELYEDITDGLYDKVRERMKK